MGFLSWLRSLSGEAERTKVFSSPAVPPVVDRPLPVRRAPNAPPSAQKSSHLSGKTRWYGYGEAVPVGGYLIMGGLIYVGTALTSPNGGTESSLINPALRINSQNPDWAGQSLDYWPSYESITPAARAAYLTWLADGRRYPEVPIGYVFLFMYGLEHRVLVDIGRDPSLAGELVPIRAEMLSLLNLHGDRSSSFSGYASRFLNLIDFMLMQGPASAGGEPPALTESRWLVPISLKVGLGDLAANANPIPARWALAWAWFHPEIPVRTPASRCTEEFARLFTLRYQQKFGDGFTVRPGKTTIRTSYHTASSQIGQADLEMDNIPDVFAQQAPLRKLAEVFDGVSAELEPYSRWLGRNPDKAGTLAAAALLPRDLIDGSTGSVRDFQDWLTEKLAASGTALISGAELFNHWPAGATGKLSKPETVNLVTLLDSLGAALEPDVRFGGAAVSELTPVVLFRVQPGSPHSPTPAYSTALTMMHLAAAVTAADGHILPAELDHLTAHLESSLQLTTPERTRLQAHLQWLGATEVKLTGLTKRLESLSGAQKAAVGDMLVTVAAADGHIAPAEVTTLQKIYKLLGLEASTVSSRLHAAMTGSLAPARGPVTVRPAGEPDPGYPIPVPPTTAPAETGFVLDPTIIQAKMSETAAVSALLGGIFDEDQTLPAPEPGGPERPQQPGPEEPAGTNPGAAFPVAGLDQAHSSMLHALAGRNQLDRNEFEDLAAHHGLLPDGALDTLNEAALDASDEPLIEGDEILIINVYALKELCS
ncbi:TerB N-terminal domain-containing protein [Arthrobacter echini]|nr:TerB N-terminal domain-containing protein [Arthrobacter echini]